MKVLNFKCTFLSNVILNASSATAQSSEGLDYIPGSKFLGIVAKKQYSGDVLDLFHNGKVRFGDAHVLNNDIRSIKMPLSFFEDKNAPKGTYKYWTDALLATEDRKKLTEQGIQLKQVRKGYFSPKIKSIQKPKANFSIKSAYDADKRRSKDEQMYGYLSLPKGSTWQFSVELDDDVATHSEAIQKALIGEHGLGKSRSAEYGRVKIELTENESNSIPSSVNAINGIHVLYAESNLCFIDENGQPTVTPSAQDLGFPEGYEIDWSKTQIRHRLYAPWNGTRAARDCDRWIIEKGSVFVMKESNIPVSLDNFNKGRGLYRAEGFGKVILNPAFLALKETQLSKAEQSAQHFVGSVVSSGAKDKLIKDLIALRAEQSSPNKDIAKAVSEFMIENAANCNKISNSQWGQIRNFAQNLPRLEDLELLLFNKDIGFLHTAKRKNVWAPLASKLNKATKNSGNSQAFLIALASEMAKKEKTKSE